MQSQTKTYNRGRNIVWGMWQRKPPMVIAGCSLLSFFSYRCYFSSADVLALIICCSTIVLCSCELQCAAFSPVCSACTLLCYYSTLLCYSTSIAIVRIAFITVVLIVIYIAVVAIVSFTVVLFVLLSSSSPKISRKKRKEQQTHLSEETTRVAHPRVISVLSEVEFVVGRQFCTIFLAASIHSTCSFATPSNISAQVTYQDTINRPEKKNPVSQDLTYCFLPSG